MDHSKAEHNSDTQQAPAQNPVMDVVAPPPVDKAPVQPSASAPEHSEHQNQHPQTMPKRAVAEENTDSNGVGFAIFATVVIVLGLAALATYAYLKTTK